MFLYNRDEQLQKIEGIKSPTTAVTMLKVETFLYTIAATSKNKKSKLYN